MTSIVRIASPTVGYGWSLIIPAYRSAFTSIGKVWALLALGAFLTIKTDFYFDGFMDDQFQDLGWIASALFLVSFPAMFFVYLVGWTKIWTVCYNAQNPQEMPLNSLFGRKEKAALGAFVKVTLASAFLTAVPLIILAGAVAIFNTALLGGITLSDMQQNALSISWCILHQIIIARYLMALPMSIAGVSCVSIKSDLLGQAWRRTKDWYLTILAALIPIAIFQQVASHILWSIIGVAVHKVTIGTTTVLAGLGNFLIPVISALAALQVILKIWPQTRATEFD